MDKRSKHEAKEASRHLLGQGLECQALGWISATGEKAEEEQENQIPLREMKEQGRRTIWDYDRGYKY